MEEYFQVVVNVRGETRYAFIDSSNRLQIGDPSAKPPNPLVQHRIQRVFRRIEAALLAEVIQRNYNVSGVTVEPV